MLKKIKSVVATTVIVSLLALVFDIAVLSSIAEAKRYGGSRGGFSRSKSYSKPKTTRKSKTTVSKGTPPIKKTTVTTTTSTKQVKKAPPVVKKKVAVPPTAKKPVVKKVTNNNTSTRSSSSFTNNSTTSVTPPSRMSGIMDSVVGTVAGFWIYNAIFGDDKPPIEQPLEPTEEVPNEQVN